MHSGSFTVTVYSTFIFFMNETLSITQAFNIIIIIFNFFNINNSPFCNIPFWNNVKYNHYMLKAINYMNKLRPQTVIILNHTCKMYIYKEASKKEELNNDTYKFQTYILCVWVFGGPEDTEACSDFIFHISSASWLAGKASLFLRASSLSTSQFSSRGYGETFPILWGTCVSSCIAFFIFYSSFFLSHLCLLTNSQFVHFLRQTGLIIPFSPIFTPDLPAGLSQASIGKIFICQSKPLQQYNEKENSIALFLFISIDNCQPKLNFIDFPLLYFVPRLFLSTDIFTEELYHTIKSTRHSRAEFNDFWFTLTWILKTVECKPDN